MYWLNSLPDGGKIHKRPVTAGVYFGFGADNVPGTAHSFYGVAISPALCRGRGTRLQLELRPFTAGLVRARTQQPTISQPQN